MTKIYLELKANNLEVLAGETLSITCEAIDADGDNLTYKWSANSGVLNGNGSDINWTAPNLPVIIQLSVWLVMEMVDLLKNQSQ